MEQFESESPIDSLIEYLDNIASFGHRKANREFKKTILSPNDKSDIERFVVLNMKNNTYVFGFKPSLKKRNNCVCGSSLYGFVGNCCQKIETQIVKCLCIKKINAQYYKTQNQLFVEIPLGVDSRIFSFTFTNNKNLLARAITHTSLFKYFALKESICNSDITKLIALIMIERSEFAITTYCRSATIKPIEIICGKLTTIKNYKTIFITKTDLKINNFYLKFCDKILDDECRTLIDYNITNLSHLKICEI